MSTRSIQLVKNTLGHFEKKCGGLRYAKNELLVVNFHSTPKKFIPHFKEQVIFLKKRFHIIDPSQLTNYFDGSLKPETCALLFTFDDGLKNNLYAAGVLNELGIRALFFVVPGFIDTPANGQKQFYLQHIRQRVDPSIDGEPEDLTAMSWQELKELCAAGHEIGAHTLTHTLVAKNSSLQNSENEILSCKTRIETALNGKVNAFCSINNTLESTGKKEKELIEKNYTFHFTTLPGYNASNQNRHFIKRRNIECFWPWGAFYYAMGQWDLKRWSEKIRVYENV